MAITPNGNHVSGNYPDTVRHITNGDPANQTFLRNATLDLDYRTEMLRLFTATLEATATTNLSTLTAFNQNHDHSGSNGEKVLSFGQIYANSSQTAAYFNLAAAATFAIKKNGGAGAANLFYLNEAGTTPKTKIQFPGSDDLFDHQAATAANLTLNPHGLKLAARVLTISEGCQIDGATGGPYAFITLNTATAVNGLFSALGLAGHTPSDGVAAEGVLVGDVTTPGGYKSNIVLIRDSTSGLPILQTGNPVYGLLQNTGTVPAPVWTLSFYAAGIAYSFATTVTVKLYGQTAYTLSGVPVVDPAFVALCQLNIAL